MIKSYLSLLCILQIILKDENCRKERISNYLYFYSLKSQLLDDLNDIEQDINSNINTLFTNKDIVLTNILKLIKLIYLDKSNHSNFLFDLFVANYGLSKLNNKKLKLDIYMPFSYNYLDKLRKIKNDNIKNINIKKPINKSLLQKNIFNV